MLEDALNKIISVAVLLLSALALGYGLWRLVEIPQRRWRASTFDYVYIDDNGEARELNADEDEYLSTALFLDDAELNIKPRYGSLTPTGAMHGYLKRRQLPRWVPIAATPSQEPVTSNRNCGD